MDPISQASLGAVFAQSTTAAGRLRQASLAGALAGFLPDADVLIRSPSDPLLFLDYHRHFTHALAFVPIGGALTAGLCVLLSRGRARFRDLLLPCLVGWGSHGLLDACTSYGTYLYWPFSQERVAWHIVSIVDPLFTLPLLFGVLWAARRKAPNIARAFLLLAAAYLALGTFQLGKAEALQQELVLERGHETNRAEVKPSLGNNILFRAFYEHDGTFHVDAIRVPWFGEPQVYPGGSHSALVVEDFLEQHSLDQTRRNDIARFDYFSAGYLIEDPRHPGMISDFRYAAVPNAVAPLWGIDVLGTPPGRHPSLTHFRDIDAAKREQLVDMLLGH